MIVQEQTTRVEREGSPLTCLLDGYNARVHMAWSCVDLRSVPMASAQPLTDIGMGCAMHKNIHSSMHWLWLCKFTRDVWPDSIWLVSVVGQADDFGVLRALTKLRADLGSLRLQQGLVKRVSYRMLIKFPDAGFGDGDGACG